MQRQMCTVKSIYILYSKSELVVCVNVVDYNMTSLLYVISLNDDYTDMQAAL